MPIRRRAGKLDIVGRSRSKGVSYHIDLRVPNMAYVQQVENTCLCQEKDNKIYASKKKKTSDRMDQNNAKSTLYFFRFMSKILFEPFFLY